MKTYVDHPPRKRQSLTCTGPVAISSRQKRQRVRDRLTQDGVDLPMPTGD